MVCKLEFETDKCLKNNFESHNAGNEIHQQYKWNETLKDDFLNNFLTTFNTYLNSMGFPLTNIENELEKFKECLYKSAGNMKKKCLYNDNYSLKKPVWWNEECQRLKQLRLYSLRKYRNSNKNDDFLQYKIVRNKFKAKCEQSRLNLERENRSKLVPFRKNAKTFWSLIRTPTKRYDKSSNVSYKEWVDHFKNLHEKSNIDCEENILSDIVHDCDDSYLNEKISSEEIKQSIKRVKPNKSAGPSGLCIELYKHTSDVILPFLTELFNTIYDTGYFPVDWRTSIVVPLHKSGPTDNPHDYRGISLINSLCKVFINILTNRLSIWTERNDILNEAQAGFRKNYSIVDNIFTLLSLVQKYLSKKKEGGFIVYLWISEKLSIVSITRNFGIL